MDVRLIAVHEREYDAFFALFAEYHHELNPYDPTSTDDLWDLDAHRAAILDDMEDREIDWIEVDGERAGFVMVRTSPDWPREERRIAEIAEFYVLPAFRRRGVGTAAVRAVIERHHARGVYEVEASILPGNEPAQAFWSRLGFEVRAIVTARRL